MISFGVVTLYLMLAGFIYLADFFNWQIGPTAWAEQVGQSYAPPSSENILGTDMFGHSVLRKMLYGTKVSMTVALCASLISIAICVPLRAIAGFFRGFVDDIIVWI